MQDVTTKKGEPRKKLRLIYKNTTSAEFLEYFIPKLQFFVKHSFVAKWEDRQFRECLANFPPDTVVSVIDFAENYSFEVQNEVQSMHWHSYQVTILVQISWIRNPHPDPCDESSKTLCKYHFYVSDDKTHDSYFVQHCLTLHYEDLVLSGFKPRRHWVWSDGCSSQFKSKVPWYFVSRYPEITDGCKCLWSFFGSGHSKGPHDGAGAVLKRFIRQKQLDVEGPKLQCAADIVNLLHEHLSGRPETSYNGGDRRPVHRTFWLVEVDDVDREHEYMVDTIEGTRDLHSVQSVNRMEVNKLLKRNLACFCFACIDEKWGECINMAWCGDWKMEMLRPESVGYVQDTMKDAFNFELWDDFGTNGELLGACLELGDNFATPADEDNEEGVSFYLLACCTKPYIVQDAFICPWGEHFAAGDMVVQARYYQKYGTGIDTYVFLKKSKIAHVHVGDIRAVKFPMVPAEHRVSGNDPVYKLDGAVHERILDILELR
jgi:hypothetical protein